MKKTYGFVKCRLAQEDVALKASGPNHQTHEIQYHLHPQLSVSDGDGGFDNWDSAINVGTNDSDDLVQYKIVNDFHHPIIEQLQAAPPGFNDLTAKGELPALDFLRSDILSETGPWRNTDPMDGDESAEPIRSIKRLLQNAYRAKADLYLFGRLYDEGGSGLHDIHMNQGSKGKKYFNDGSDKDGNLVWQDGAVIVNVGTSWSAYFAVFTQQVVPTDDLGNPVKGAHPITADDEGSERALAR
jgi:uncharacterized protein YukJ